MSLELPPVHRIGGLRVHPRMALVASEALERFRGLATDIEAAAVRAAGAGAACALSLVGGSVFDKVIAHTADTDGALLVGFEGEADAARLEEFTRAVIAELDALPGVGFYRMHTTCMRRTHAEIFAGGSPRTMPWQGRVLWGRPELAAGRIEAPDGRRAELRECVAACRTLPIILAVAREGLPPSIDLSILPVFGWPEPRALEDLPHGTDVAWFGRVCFGDRAAEAWRGLDARHVELSGVESGRGFAAHMLGDTRKAFLQRLFLKTVKWLCKSAALAGDEARLATLAGFLAELPARAYAAIMRLTVLEKLGDEGALPAPLVRAMRTEIGEDLAAAVASDDAFAPEIRGAVEGVTDWAGLACEARIALGRAIVPAGDAAAKRFLDRHPDLITHWFR